MKKFRNRSIITLSLLIIFVLSALGILMGVLFKTYYFHTVKDHLEKEGLLLARYIEKSGGISFVDEDMLSETKNILNARIVVVNPSGSLIYDSGSTDGQKHNIEKLITEITNNKTQDSGFFIDDEEEVEKNYYWKKIESGNESDVLVVGTTGDYFQTAYRQIWFILISCLSIAFLLILFISKSIIDKVFKPVDSATKVAIELAKGNYRARTYEETNKTFNGLTSSINTLARNLQLITTEQEIQTNRLMTLIENMGSSLIFIDDKGYIVLMNRIFKEVFHIDDTNGIGKSYQDVIDDENINKLIAEVFMTEQKIRRQIAVPIGIAFKFFEIYGAPIISHDNEWKGSVFVFHDITELKKLEQVRKDFVANVSHELKTPITSIRGFAETLLDGASQDKEALNSFLTIIFKESERLTSLIQDLLELSRIEQSGFTMQIEKVNLVTVMSEVVAILKERADKKQIEVKFPLQHTSFFIEGDALRIKQIFINLLSNAISYTLNTGEISINFQEDDENIFVSITDTGIGMEKSQIPRIFERFYRVDKDRSRNSGGTGLGLAIVKHLVEAHHGELDVQSVIGQGSTFTIKFFKKFPQR
ncbi:two-component system histidine kinase PnpS [Bacillus kwashiorkori]|uniref:two-component system histidine kinase PnpS n=1 Tax=Bacillus kwashiorkori TaxID=1522318 RepID=UPI000781DEB9|nr:ATP-binding protein [Bacillus kwashiorkori]